MSIFQHVFANINKEFILGGDWALGYNFMRF